MTATIDHVNGHMPDDPYPGVSFTEQAANADATRLRAAADAEAARLKAQADAEARATAQAVKNAKAAAEIAELAAAREATERAAAEQRKAAQAEAAAQAAQLAAARAETERQEKARQRADRMTKAFVAVSLAFSLPLQVVAFVTMSRWLFPAPFILEYAAWVMLSQLDAAVHDKRPTWHYRVALLLVATFAAYQNLMHGHQFGPGVGEAGAFASLAGPLMWDLHTHGRINRRDGRPTRAQKREQRAAARAKEQAAAAEAKREADLKAAAAAEAAQLDERRRIEHPEVYERAAYIASASGQLTITEQVWKRAWWDVMGEGAELGETAESIAARLAATAALREARVGDQTPLPVVLQDGRIRVYKQPASPKVTTQIPPATAKAADRPKPTPPRRQKGDTPAYSPLARSAAAETARKAVKK